jgi:hydroxyacylglutathione hydrolase
LQEATGATVCLHKKDIWLYRIMPLQYKMAHIKAKWPARIDHWLEDGERFAVGDLSLDVLHTPGHSPGSCSFHLAANQLLFSGDCLFRESVGNWEYPGGNFESLVRSITEKLFLLPDDTRVIPGHKEETTIGHEKANNKYLKPEFIADTRKAAATRPSKLKTLWMLIWHMFTGK